MIALLLLWPLYIIGIQYERGGWWRVLLPVTLAAAILDVVLNYTELALLTWDMPRHGEYTFSMRLGRLQRLEDWRGKMARFIEKYMLGPFDPDGFHVKAG